MFRVTLPGEMVRRTAFAAAIVATASLGASWLAIAEGPPKPETKTAEPLLKGWVSQTAPDIWESDPRWERLDGFAWYRCQVKIPLEWGEDRAEETQERPPRPVAQMVELLDKMPGGVLDNYQELRVSAHPKARRRKPTWRKGEASE